MRRARITYQGAWHHVMNRGHEGNDIFSGAKNKSLFVEYLADSAKKMRIRILAYCVMDTHYHFALENSSGKMSEFIKRLNGIYGMAYRKLNGGKGYVFQGRYKSTLIEKDAYLLQSIAYLLRNPVRAGIVQNAEHYIWSSINAYYSKEDDDIVDVKFVNGLFGTKKELMNLIHKFGIKELPVIIEKYGEVLGSSDFRKMALEKYNRRTRPSSQSKGNQRKNELNFDPVKKIIWEFERISGVKVDEIVINTLEGKRQRGKLLVMLKDAAGLTYKEISRFEIYGDLKFSSLREIYRSVKLKKLKVNV